MLTHMKAWITGSLNYSPFWRRFYFCFSAQQQQVMNIHLSCWHSWSVQQIFIINQYVDVNIIVRAGDVLEQPATIKCLHCTFLKTTDMDVFSFYYILYIRLTSLHFVWLHVSCYVYDHIFLLGGGGVCVGTKTSYYKAKHDIFLTLTMLI